MNPRAAQLPAVELKDRIAYSSQMKRATLTDTKNNLSALVDQVQHEGDDPEGRLSRLERQGLLRRASDPLPQEILMAAAPRPTEGASALAALLDERRNGR